MSKGRLAWVALLCLLVVAAVGLLFLPGAKREPRYYGRTLSEWILPPSGYVGRVARPAGYPGQEEALEAMGTNALQYLVKWMVHEPSSFQRRIQSALAKLPPRLQPESLSPSAAIVRAYYAEGALKKLGPKAAPAVPALMQVVNTTSNETLAYATLQTLVVLGSEAFPGLMTVATNVHHGQARRFTAMRLLPRFGTNAVPALLVNLRDNNTSLSSTAAQILCSISPARPEVVVTFTAMLESPSAVRRVQAAYYLGSLGPVPEAQAAAERLRRATNDPDAQVRATAARALELISPHRVTNQKTGGQ